MIVCCPTRNRLAIVCAPAQRDGPELHADVGITGDRIAAVERTLPTNNVAEVIDATGLMLCPGFIDMHAHTALESFRDPRLEPKVAQGFTTEVINPDGLAPAPVAEGGCTALLRGDHREWCAR
jgi:N-acyl-D-aspartate/D-glutamate deacylase